MSAVRLGIFIVAALAIFATGLFLIGEKEFLFHHTYRLNAAFDRVAGLTEGAEVRVGGIHKGTVRRIDLPSRPDQKIIVEMDLEPVTRAVVKQDSLAVIEAEGLIGDKYVEVTFGSAGSPKVKSGDTIQSEPPLEVSALVKKADGLLDEMQGAVKDIGRTAGNLNEVTAKINTGKGTLGALVNDRQMYQKVNAGVTEFAEDMEALKHNFFLRGFFHKRGYEDATGIGKHEIGAVPPGTPQKTFAFDAKKLFHDDQTAKLSKDRDLNEAGRFLESGGFSLAVVKVDGGPTGDRDKQKELTRARAAVVRDYLASNFKLDDTRVKTMGLGKTGTGRVEIAVWVKDNRLQMNADKRK
jgi:phospholipid/cholesterol/gamma-HCH transport system substrate-binding protein